MNDISQLVKYEVPILRHIIKNYEAMGYSHNCAEQHAVQYYSQELRNAYEMGISPEVEDLIIQERWNFDRLVEKRRADK